MKIIEKKMQSTEKKTFNGNRDVIIKKRINSQENKIND